MMRLATAASVMKARTRRRPPRQLEPPGYLGLNYGVQTPIHVLVAHLVFGAILGAFYRLPPG